MLTLHTLNFGPREPRVAEIRDIPDIMLRIPTKLKVYSLIKLYWGLWCFETGSIQAEDIP